uniref:Uncharacterized protein n=1 Tax=Parastrongyloides trichosuri TaxID=131310 RepID=A0A0N4ZGC9_PARTI
MKKLFYIRINYLYIIVVILISLNLIKSQTTYERYIYNGRRVQVPLTTTSRPVGQINVSAIFKKEEGDPPKSGAYVFAVIHPSLPTIPPSSLVDDDGQLSKDKSKEVPRLTAKETIQYQGGKNDQKKEQQKEEIKKEEEIEKLVKIEKEDILFPKLNLTPFEEIFDKINSDQKLTILWIVSVIGAVTLTLLFVYIILCLWNYRSRPKFDRSHVISYRRPEELDILFEERRKRNDEVARLVRETSPRMYNHQEIHMVNQRESGEEKVSRLEREVMLLKQTSLQEADPFIRKSIRKVSL